MAHVFRLIVLAFLFSCSAVHAVVPQTPSGWTGSTIPGPYSSKSACIQAQKSDWDKKYPTYVSCRVWTDSDTGNMLRSVLSGCAGGSVSCQASAMSCPENSNPDGNGGCQCATNYEEKNGQCVKKPLECGEGYVQLGDDCVPKDCEGEEVRDPVTNLCVKPPECKKGEVRVNGKCEKTKCPKAGTAGSDDYEMSSESDEFMCISMGVGTSSSSSGGDGTLYCMLRVRNHTTVAYNGITAYIGAAKFTGAECKGGSDSSGSGPGSGGDGGGDGGGSGPGSGPGTGPGTGPGNGGSGPEPKPPQPGAQPLPKPPSKPPGPDGSCPPGYTKKNGNCYGPTPPPKDPDQDGKCPTGTYKIGNKCVYPEPSGPDDDGDGGSTDNPGNGSGGGGGSSGNSSFGGTCKSGFACKGDAIQCAMAREQFIRNCQLDALADTAETKLWEKNRDFSAEGKKVTDGLKGNSEFTISVNGGDEFIGGGTGLTDQNIDLGRFGVLNLPLSQFNYWLSIMGNVFVIICSIVGAMTIIRRH